MAHKISMINAEKKYQHEIESREMVAKGINPKISRLERKRQLRLSKLERFSDMLKSRGGHIDQKEPSDKEKDKNEVKNVKIKY